ncbi:MAG: baseplate J/gp47 family protein [Oscillospiraceae bacterium]|nr:baseplate J/gp47 family protein [Oscillospiraceae bacterium]
MIDLSKKTYRNILQAQLDRVPNSLDKREGSMIQTALGAGAYSLEEFYLELDQIQRGAYLQTAAGQDLEYLAVLANVQRYPASPAVRLGVFNIDVPTGSRFSTTDGADSVNFVAAERVGGGQYKMTCETPGTIGNRYTGPILPITYIQGLTSAELTDILVAGDDTEDDESLRKRAVSALNEQPFGGNVADYKRVVLAIGGVGGLQVYPTWKGGGTVKLSIIGADWMPASPQLVEEVQNTVDPPPDQGLGYGTAPIGATVTVTTPEAVEINISATLVTGGGYTAAQLSGPVRQAVDGYLLSIRQEWDTPEASGMTHYASWVYAARVTAAILSVQGVVNVTGLTVNGSAADLQLAEDGFLQQVPVLGEVAVRA